MTAPVLIDDRAGSRELVKWPPLDGIGELTRLDSADCAIVGEGPADTAVLVGVEVKSVWDVISSANTGRLQATQVPAMLETYDATWLLIYGEYRAHRDGSLVVKGKGDRWRQLKLGTRVAPYGYLEALLMDLACLGVHVKHAVDLPEAARWIGVLHRWWSKPWSKHHGLRTFDRSRQMSLMPEMDAGTALRARVAAQLPGVGFERALAAARHFPSVLAMLSASAEEWAKVNGVGKVIAKAVVAAVR